MTLPSALIIEDDPRLSEIFAEAVRSAGYEVEVIQDGQDALTRLAETEPDLVVLDLHLPKVAGPDILKQIRADVRLAKTRVMIVTADAGKANELTDDSDLILLKPVSVAQIRMLASRYAPRRPESSATD